MNKLTKIYNAGIYIRLSKEDGDDIESESIKNQRSLIKQYITNNYDKIKFIKEYVDDGYSGSTFKRPAWDKLLEDLNRGIINTIITKDLSRMGRDYIKMGEYIEKIFPEQDIRYIAINDDIDTIEETPGLEFLQFKLIFNDYYLKDTSKKIRKILKTKKEQGKFLGWKAPYGYKKDPKDKNKILIDEEVADNVIEIFKLAYEEKKPQEIAEILTAKKILTPKYYANKEKLEYNWSPRTIEDMLRNETYIGNMTQGKRKKINYKSKKEIRIAPKDWIIVKNTHEPIIDKKTFYTVQSLVNKNKHKQVNKNTQTLSGLLYCKECGHKIGINRSSDKKRFYCHCSYYTANSKKHLCTPHSCNYQKLEAQILNNLKNIYKEHLNYNLLETELLKIEEKHFSKNIISEKILKLKRKIQNNLNYIDKIYDDYLKENIDYLMYKRISSKYQEEINKIKTQIENLEKDLVKLKNNNHKLNISDYLELSLVDTRFIVRLIDKILISEDKTIEIYYKFKV